MNVLYHLFKVIFDGFCGLFRLTHNLIFFFILLVDLNRERQVSFEKTNGCEFCQGNRIPVFNLYHRLHLLSQSEEILKAVLQPLLEHMTGAFALFFDPFLLTAELIRTFVFIFVGGEEGGLVA